MVALVYPSTLPCPTAAPLQRAERRTLSSIPGPRQSRSAWTDRLSTQSLQFVMLTGDQLQTWLDWYTETLKSGAAWFAASWPQPEGGVGVRRFVGAPSYPEFLGLNVGWRVSAQVQIRGRGMPPDDGAVTGIFYADFRDATPTDRIDPAAPFVESGGGGIYSGGLFFSTDGGGFDFGNIAWTGEKLDVVSGVPWTLECDVAWTTLPNATMSRIMRALVNPDGSSAAYELGFGGPSGLVRWRTFGGTQNDMTTIPSGSARTHIAMQQTASGGFQVYIGGARVFDGAGATFAGSGVEISIGRVAYQGACNYSIDNLRLRLGAVYSGGTIVPPHYSS